MAFYPYNYFLFGLICNFGGIGALFYSWKSTLQLKELTTILGWSLIIAAALNWIDLSGWEFGLLYAITLPSFSALLYVGLSAEIKNRKVKVAVYKSMSLPSSEPVLRLFGKLFLMLPFSLTASVAVSYGLSILLVSSEINQLVLAICVLPVIWGSFYYWIIASRTAIRPVLTQASLAILSLILVSLA